MLANIKTIRVIHSTETDPHFNLALEESLLRDRTTLDTAYVLVYRNAPSVIFGRNQNPWLECDCQYAIDNRIPLIRRESGGGTVYHDVGNVNYSFIVPRQDYDPTRFVGYAVDILRELGVCATQCERHAIWIREKKVSGSAFMVTGRRALLHGCILVDTDLEALRRILRVPEAGIEGKLVSSVSSSVTCLSEYFPEMTSDRFSSHLYDTFGRRFGTEPGETVSWRDVSADSTLHGYYSQYASWDWNFGRTGTFTQRLEVGSVELVLTVHRGMISDVAFSVSSERSVASSSQEEVEECLPSIAKMLIGTPYDGAAIARKLGEGKTMPGEQFRKQLPECLCKHIPAGNFPFGEHAAQYD